MTTEDPNVRRRKRLRRREIARLMLAAFEGKLPAAREIARASFMLQPDGSLHVNVDYSDVVNAAKWFRSGLSPHETMSEAFAEITECVARMEAVRR